VEFRARPRRKAVINLTPLIDVLFMLLIFFVVSTQFREHPAIPVELPTAAHAVPGRVDPFEVTIEKDGRIHFRGRVVGLAALEPGFREHLKTSPDDFLSIRADTNTSYGVVIQVMDIARTSGVKGFQLPTQLRSLAEPTTKP